MSKTIKSLGAILFAALAGSSPAAHAQAFGTTTYAVSTWSYIDGNGQHHPGNVCDTSAGICNTSMPYASASAVTTLGASSGSVQAVSIGREGAGAANVISYWWDTFTITSATLPAGTPVLVEVHIDLQASVQESLLAPAPYTRGQAGMTYGGRDAPAQAYVGTQPGAPLSSTGSFVQVVGQSFTMYGGLYLATETGYNPAPDAGSVTASALYSLRVLTPEAGYSTASGTFYGSPVPEAPSAALLLAGLAAVGWIGRRRFSVNVAP